MKRQKFLSIITIMFLLTSCSNIDNKNNPSTDISVSPSQETKNTNTNITIEPSIKPDITTTDSSESKNPEPTMSTGGINNLWPPKKPDYLVNISNYDLASDKEKYLLRIKLYPGGDYDYPILSYLIDINELDQIKGYYEISDNSIVPKDLQQNVLRVSEDGQKALIVYRYAPKGQDNIVEIYDIVNHKVLYQYKTQYNYLDNMSISASPNLDYLLLPSDDDYSVFYDSRTNEETQIMTTPIGIISPDGIKTAVIDSSKDIRKLKIYNLFSGELLDEVSIGDKDAYLSQWNETGKILYYTFNGSFYYDINTKNIVSLGSYFYAPIMSPDGKFVAFYKSEEVDPFFPLWSYWLHKECGYREGLFIKNLITGSLVQVAPVIFLDEWIFSMVPMEWVYVNKDFDNNGNRYFTRTDKENKYKVDCSSIKDRYYGENVIDGDINTAWVEEGFAMDEQDESDSSEKGIGEWIKIYIIAQVFNSDTDPSMPIHYLQSMHLSGIKIINGYAKSEEIYIANNRVKKVEVILTDGTSYTFDLKDNNLDFQTLDFGKEIETRDVTIKILDVFDGTKFNDTCISEVQLVEAGE